MGLKDTIEKLEKYQARLASGTASKIELAHLAELEERLHTRQDALRRELSETEKPEKRIRLQDKLDLVQLQLNRAHWLRDELDRQTR